MKMRGGIGMASIGIVLAAAAATAQTAAPKIGAAARSFPETQDRIRVFADQLPSQVTDAQARFIAAHYAGSQKQMPSWTRRIRALNPNFIVLHYQLAVGNGPAEFLEGEKWTNDFAAVQKHEDWFLHDAQGRRLHQTAWDWNVMNIAFQDGKPRTGYPTYWTDTALRRMRANEDDGCFADSYTQDILINQLTPEPPLFQNIDLTKRDWLPSLNAYGAYCTDIFHRQPEKFYFLPNFGGLITTWDTITNYSVGDGGMNEGFAAPGPGSYYTVEDWKLAMSHLLALSARNKILLCQTGIEPGGSDHRWFIVGSYLLIKGSRSYLNMISKSSLEWYPEYDLDLGPPVKGSGNASETSVNAYWRADWGLYCRDYAKGFVLVNPSEKPVAIAQLDAPARMARADGGGAVGADGNPDGMLSFSPPVRTVTVPAHSARVFLK